jgi:hypothetical protein
MRILCWFGFHKSYHEYSKTEAHCHWCHCKYNPLRDLKCRLGLHDWQKTCTCHTCHAKRDNHHTYRWPKHPENHEICECYITAVKNVIVITISITGANVIIATLRHQPIILFIGGKKAAVKSAMRNNPHLSKRILAQPN